MPSLELIWLDSTGSTGLPFWTVPSKSTSPTTRMIAALAGFDLYGTASGSSSFFDLQTFEVRTLIRNFSSNPGLPTWVSVEVVPRLSSGGRVSLSLGNFQVALFLIHDDGPDALSAGTVSLLGGQAPAVPLDDPTTTVAAGLVAGFSATFPNGAVPVSTLGVQNLVATTSTVSGPPTVQLQGTAFATSDGVNSFGSVDAAFLAWVSATPAVLQLPWTVSAADLLLNTSQQVLFPAGSQITSAVVALNGFTLGFDSSIPDQRIRGGSIQITNLAFAGNAVTFQASASFPNAASADADEASLQLAVFATTA